jgi:hypothetical protein
MTLLEALGNQAYFANPLRLALVQQRKLQRLAAPVPPKETPDGHGQGRGTGYNQKIE